MSCNYLLRRFQCRQINFSMISENVLCLLRPWNYLKWEKVAIRFWRKTFYFRKQFPTAFVDSYIPFLFLFPSLRGTPNSYFPTLADPLYIKLLLQVEVKELFLMVFKTQFLAHLKFEKKISCRQTSADPTKT